MYGLRSAAIPARSAWAALLALCLPLRLFVFSSRRRHTRFDCDWSSDVCSSDLERALRARRRRPMFMVDLAVPRDIEPEVGELDDVFLYTVDDLAEIVSLNLDARRSAVDQAEAIIESQVGQFMHWMQARESVPLIRALREHAEHARRGEVERALKLLQRGQDAARGLESLSEALTNKLMHGPTQALNDAAGDERRALADTLARLFRVK